MPSVTADTNIYISGLLFGGPPRRLLELARAGTVRLDISDEIMAEVLRVLREKFESSPERLQETREKLTSITRHVTPTQSIDAIEADPSDNRILECAVTANSDYIVTGDTRHILPLGSYAGIPIVKVAPFLDLLGRRQGRQRAGIE